MISDLQDSRGDLDDEMNEATDAIAMLEDELDSNDAQVKELLDKLTLSQHEFLQADKSRTALEDGNTLRGGGEEDRGVH